LSGELLKRSNRVNQLDLFEADRFALSMAQKGIGRFVSDNGSFNWIDVTTEFPKKPYNWVIMNPPFHSGRAATPALGQRFIEVAASTLIKGGKLLMVANQNLPYERTLEKQFRKFEKLDERDGFKIIEALK
jgi:16S rRNA (guanine1207-N2)-methyltransferase